MGNSKRQQVVLAAMIIVIFAGIGTYVLMSSRAAGSDTMVLSPASSSLALGSTLTVTIQENSSTDAVNAVEADLKYDQTKLQYVSTSTSSGAFNSLVAHESGGSGVVEMGLATGTAVTGLQTVATVTFHTIGTGTTAISFASTSAIIRASDTVNVLGTATGGSYTIADDTAPSVPAGLTMSSRTTTSISFSWTASTDNVGVTGYKVYRNGTQVGISATTSYSDSGLTEGTSYSYTVAAYDAAGNTSAKSTAVAIISAAQAGDINGDGVVNVLDLSIIASNYGKTGMTLAQGDLNGDGVVNIYDLSIIASNWGK
jgi:chitodextrinase